MASNMKRFCWLYSTLLPEPWAAADGPRWCASRESHPSEDLSELPPQSGFNMGRSIITRLLMRVGLGKPRHNAKQPTTGCFGTDGNRSAPYLAVFDAGLFCTGGLGASSRVALASLSGALSSTDVSLLPDILFSKSK